MESRAHALAAGLFALVFGAAIVFALWWFSDRRDDTREVVFVTRGSVNGLNPQGTVRYRGILAGKVDSIRLDPQDVRNLQVRAHIRSDLPLTRGTRARLASQGVTGIAFIALDDRGEDPAPLTAPAGQVPSIRLEPGLIETLGDAAEATLQRVREVAEHLATLTGGDNLARIERTLASVESASAGLDRSLKEVPPAIAALRQLAGPENQRHLRSTLASLDRLAGDAAPLAGDVRTLVQKLSGVAERIDNLAGGAGEGFTTSTLPRLNVLLQELTTTSRQLNDLLDELDTSPQLLLLGRGKAPPGPGEPGYQRHDRPPLR